MNTPTCETLSSSTLHPATRFLISASIGTGTFVLLVTLTLVLTGYFRIHLERHSVNLFIWSSYLGPDTLRIFTDRTGIQVQYDLYDSNEAVLAKLQAGHGEYDVIVPSDYMVKILIHQGLLMPLDRTRLSNLKNVDKEFLGLSFDPEDRFHVPFVWGTTGIGYRKDRVLGNVDSWKCLWDPRYRNRISMLDDCRETIGAALKSQGHSLNSTDPTVISSASEELVSQKSLLKEYNSSNFQDQLISGEVWLAQGYNGQIARAAREFPFIGYAIPGEGCTRSVDSLCIPRDAPHVAEAHDLINFLLDPRVAADLCSFTCYSTANREARKFLSPEMLTDPAVFPNPSLLSTCEYIVDVGRATALYDRHWTEIKSR